MMMSRILTAWDPDPSVIIGCVVLAVAYAIASRDLTPNPFPLGKGNQKVCVSGSPPPEGRGSGERSHAAAMRKPSFGKWFTILPKVGSSRSIAIS